MVKRGREEVLEEVARGGTESKLREEILRGRERTF